MNTSSGLWLLKHSGVWQFSWRGDEQVFLIRKYFSKIHISCILSALTNDIEKPISILLTEFLLHKPNTPRLDPGHHPYIWYSIQIITNININTNVNAHPGPILLDPVHHPTYHPLQHQGDWTKQYFPMTQLVKPNVIHKTQHVSYTSCLSILRASQALQPTSMTFESVR